MFEWKEKASNAILLDDNVGGKGKCFRAKFLQPGLVKYSFGVCLLNKEVIDRFVYQFEGCPVVIDHKDVTTESAKDDRVGVISKVWFNECDSWYWCDGVIFDQEALDLIDKGFNVSCQYEITEYSENRENKLHNGNEYDKTILNGRPEHLAIVQNPRYENAMIAVNALDLTEKEQDENDIIQAINEIKETDMFKNLFGKKEKKMEKEEIKAIFLECLTELKASNEADDKKEEDAKNEEDKKEDKEAENKCKNEEEPDYKKLYEDLKAKMEAANEKEEKAEDKEKAKNSIDEQMAMFCKEIETDKSDYVSKAKAIELGSELF